MTDRVSLMSALLFAGPVVLALMATPEARTAGEADGDDRFASFDREVETFMQARDVPGGALAVVKDGRLVYARGYGWADRDKQTRVGPTSLFRIASVSKPFTAVAVLQLVQQGKLSLDGRAFDLLGLEPLAGQTMDPRLKTITVRQLLQHTSGWDRDNSFDPMFRPREIARVAGVAPPAGPEAISRYMLGQPLQFDPGSRSVYSNFGYCVLGRIIEKLSGKSYEQYVREAVLAPIGIRDMRIGHSLPEGRAESEVAYYVKGSGSARSAFGTTPGQVPWPYGGFNLEAMDAHGGWIASAVDLARFAAALDDPHHSLLLSPDMIGEMYALPPAPVGRKADGSPEDAWYACGWMVRPVRGTGKANYWHNGSLPGTSTLLVRRWDGLSWVVLFNQRSDDPKLSDGDIDGALHRAADAVKQWPTGDLFAQYR